MKRLILWTAVLFLTGCGPAFVPPDVEIPPGFETEQFRVRPLTAADAEKDYEAVMESIDLIHTALLHDGWPTPQFTLEENRSDLEAKERRFAKRKNFTYTVVTLDESRVLGCIYINPGMRGPDAAVFFWVRQSACDLGLEPVLEQAVRDWIDNQWPFPWVVYPGRPGPYGGTAPPERRAS